jgi:tetratricopeptide (TPR) repeat protein
MRMSEGNDRIFISYRRSASRYFARAVFQHLHFNGHDVFFDIESIGPGDFERIILGQIKARAHFLAILAPASMERLEDPNDWLRKEIEFALANGRNVIPVLHSGFDFAVHADGLTGDLQPLTKLNALPVYDEYFDEAMARLVDRYLQQPFYGEIEETVEEDREAVHLSFKEAVEEPKPTKEELSAEDYFNLGYAAKDLNEKVKSYTLAIERNPEYTFAYNNRGLAYHNLKDYDKAIADYDKTIQLDPDYALAYNNRGTAYGNLKDYDKAIADYDRAIQLDPEVAAAYTNRGTAHANLKDYDRAIADYDRAIQLDPEDAAAYNSRAVSRNLMGEVEAALRDVDRSLELDPGNPDALSTKAEILHDRGEFDRAIEWYDKAIEHYEKTGISPENVELAKLWKAQARERQPRDPRE